MTIKQISVFVENRSGKLFLVTDALSRAKIDIRALTIADTTDFGILRLIVSDPEKALAVLKDSGMTVSITEVLGVKMPDIPGSLNRVLGEFRDANISVEYCYAFISHADSSANVIFRADNLQRASEIIAGMKNLGYDFLDSDNAM